MSKIASTVVSIPSQYAGLATSIPAHACAKTIDSTASNAARASTFPSSQGEKVVLRLLAGTHHAIPFAKLGLDPDRIYQLLRHPDDKPTIGLLLVRTRNRVLVEYALAGSRHPISVAQWETRLTRQLRRRCHQCQ